jgi:putative tricarboxylic transport membrane protein
MKKFKYDGAPLVLAIVLGPLMDQSLRQSLLMSGGSGMIFFARPICLIIFAVVAIILLLPVLPRIGRMRKTVRKVDDLEG